MRTSKLEIFPEFNRLRFVLELGEARRMTRLFHHKNMGDYKRFDHAISRLTNYASDWLDSYQDRRRREGEDELAT